MSKHLVAILFFLPTLAFGASKKVDASELTVYTSRKTHLIEPILKAYHDKTGVTINHVNGDDGVLIQKLSQEGEKTNADLLITVDAGNLANAADKGLLATIDSKELLDKVGEKNRGADNKWIGLSLRARTIFYNKKSVKASDLKGYADLADPKWKGKLCLRTSRKVYNQSLVAAMIEKNGKEKTKKVVKGWVDNLAKPVFTSDTQLLEAIDKGICQVGIANTYYLARLVEEGQAKNVKVFWPSKEVGGVHVNVSGAGIVKASDQKQEAMKFLNWLVTDEAQQIFAGVNHEYPVIEDVEVTKVLKKWGTFEREPVPLKAIGPLQKKAVLLMDSVKYR